MLDTPLKTVLPPVSRLEATVLHLAKAGRHRHVIQFVGCWRQHAAPTPKTHFAEAQAFFSLRLIDKATIRLRELGGNVGLRPRALKLKGQCYLLRGWSKRAVQAFEEAMGLLPDDDELIELLNQAFVLSDEPALSLDELSDPDDLCRVAEQFLARGSFLRAQAFLEKSRRLRPNSPRVSDLLWGMAGDYSVDDDLVQLSERWGPEINLGLLVEEGENTESVTVSGVSLASMELEPSGASFPSLFRSMESTSLPPMGDEVTQASSMLALSENTGRHNGDDLTASAIEEDTQVAYVIHHSRSALGDLDAFERRLASLKSDLGDFDVGLEGDAGLEEEDDDLIIYTGAESEGVRALDLDDYLEADPTTTDVRGFVSDLLKRVGPKSKGLGPLKKKKSPKKRRLRFSPKLSRATRWLLATGVSFGLMGAVFFVLLALRFWIFAG